MIDQSNKISDSSTNIMGFLVDDLLDFAQINAGKFRKVCTDFDLREAIEEIVSIQQEKAIMQGIKLRSVYQAQSIGSSKILSLFNQPKEKEDSEDDNDNAPSSTHGLYDYDLAKATSDSKEPLLVNTDKRRL
jgi:signal transduction histidine kinase